MTLIKCKECNKEISDKAKSCPHCGFPIEETQNIENTNNVIMQNNLIKIPINKEKCSIISIILFILFSFVMYLCFISYGNEQFYFIKTSYSTYTLLECFENTKLNIYITIFTTIIGTLSFISLILTLLSKKTFKFSKVGYLLNIVTMLIFYINIYLNNLRVGNQFSLIFILNFVLLILPRFDKLISIDTMVTKEKEDRYLKNNEKLNKLYDKKTISLTLKIISIITIFLSIISFLLIIYFNNKEMTYFIQANPDDYNQIKVINDFINVRSAPNLNSTLLGKVGKNDIYNVIDKIGDENYYWYKIEYKGENAYIASEKTKPYVEELYKTTDIVKINIFYKTTCIYCENALKYLNELKKDQNYEFKLVKYNINQYKDLFIKVSQYFDITNYYVPLIIIEDDYVQGFSESTKEQITKLLNKHQKEENNIVEKIKLNDLTK